jgi:hypothetical protein
MFVIYSNIIFGLCFVTDPWDSTLYIFFVYIIYLSDTWWMSMFEVHNRTPLDYYEYLSTWVEYNGFGFTHWVEYNRT